MSLTDDGTIWIFIIDTNLYAGNFEREMCCYVTGVFAEESMGHGRPQQEMYLEDMGYSNEYENPFHQYEGSKPMAMPCHDEYGERPCGVWSSPNGAGNNSVGLFFQNEVSEEDVRFFLERAEKFCELVEKNKTEWPYKSFAGLKIRGARQKRRVTDYTDTGSWPCE